MMGWWPMFFMLEIPLIHFRYPVEWHKAASLPLRSCLMFLVMLTDAFRETPLSIPIKNRCNGKLFNLQLLQAVTKIKVTVIRGLLFANDCFLMTNQFHKWARKATGDGRILICLQELQPHHQHQEIRKWCISLPQENHIIKVNAVTATPSHGELHLPQQHSFLLCQHRCRSQQPHCEGRHLCSAFGRLKKSIWEWRRISQCTKIKVYRAVILTTLLYSCQSWTIYSRHEKLLQQFHLRCLRNIFNIR